MTTALPAIPAAAVAVIAAALEDHRLTADPVTDTPHAAAEDIALYLASSGYALVPASETGAGGAR
ncbi:hypothetical protein NMG29_06500 [Streptomyces cocklensis]|uniref:Uncharacterized protein n=1 Tax=Actinacidiphila cocklensis TaxID=887465 RepID=A0A9W4GPY7_9ACTN|nr:hypothetical protein [Actinacidiphila cocklensis]MDD1057881.1 hypothetical protein [Actinacidiphila cocklensis]CAG6392742.1 hypothetical protein SCOCK_180119 [Actinacidiphila cocklensis]